MTEQGRNGSLGRNLRVTQYDDVVPMLPEHFSFRGKKHYWNHYSPEVWISTPERKPTVEEVVFVEEDRYGLDANGIGIYNLPAVAKLANSPCRKWCLQHWRCMGRRQVRLVDTSQILWGNR